MIIVSVGLLGVIIYFAVAPKSSRMLRLAAIAALALIALSLGIAGFMLIAGPSQEGPFIPHPVFEGMEQPVQKKNTALIASFLIIFIVMMAAVVMLTRKEQQKKALMAKEAPKPAPFPVDDVPVEEEKPEEPGIQLDDPFDLKIDTKP